MSLAYSLWGVVFTSVFVVRCFILVLVLVAIPISVSPNFSLVGMIIKPKCYNYNKMLFITLHRILHKHKGSYDGDTIMLYIGV